MSLSFLKNTFNITLFRILNIFLTAVLTVLISNYLGPEYKGKLSIYMLLIMYFMQIGFLGLQNAPLYFSSQNHNFNIGIIKSLGFLLSFVTVIMYYLLLTYGSNYISIPSFPQLFIFFGICYIILGNHRNLIQHILISRGNILQYNICFISSTLVLLSTFTILYISDLFTLGNIILSYIFAECFSLALSLYHQKNLNLNYHYKINYKQLKDVLLYCLKGHPGRVVWQLNEKIDFLILNFFIGPLYVGIYSVGFAIAELLTFLASSISTVLIPHIAKESQSAKNIHFTSQTIKVVFYSSIFFALLVAISAPIVLKLFFLDSYGDAYLPLLFLLPGMIALSIVRILGAYFNAVNKPQFQSYGTISTLATTVILDLILIPYIGMSGAAIASSSAYFVNLTILLSFFLRNNDVRLSRMFFVSKSDLKILLSIISDISHKFPFLKT